jgi:hypothetical protein
VVIPQPLVVPVAPSPVGESAVVSRPSAADPFGIHLVGGSGPGNLDATAKWSDFPVLSPDYLMGDAATGLAALPFTPSAEAGGAMTAVMDAFFQQLPLWTPVESASDGGPEPSAAPLAGFPEKGNSLPPPLVKSKAGAARWPSLAAGALLATGLVAVAADDRRRQIVPQEGGSVRRNPGEQGA